MKMHRFFFQLDKLRDVPRFSTYPLYKENVAEHSYYVTLFAMFIARYLRESGTAVDISKAMSFAVMHDAEESFLGDVLLDTKKQMAVQYDDAAGDTAFDWIRDCFGNSDIDTGGLYGLWRWSKHNTIEGNIVRYADQLAALLVLKRQANAGSGSANTLSERIYNDLVAYLTHEYNSKMRDFTVEIAKCIYHKEEA